MIRWENGEPVEIILKHYMDSIKLTMIGAATNSGQVKAIDRRGSIYFIGKKAMKVIVPDEYDQKEYRKHIIIDEEDQYTDLFAEIRNKNELVKN